MIHSNEQMDARNEDFRITPLSSLHLESEVKGRLSQSLRSIETGSSDVLRSPFLKDLTDDEALSVFDKVFLDEIEKLPPAFRDLELSNREKFGPRSISIDWEKRRASLEDYFSPETHSKEIINTSETGGRLRRINYSNAVKKLKNSTNAGLPTLQRKGNVKEGILSTLSDQLEAEYPCVLFTRTQERMKTRNIWGYPISDTLNEMTIFSPLLEYHKTHSLWRASLLGPDSVDARINRLLSLPGKHVSIDFSAYDAHVKEHLQKSSGDFIKSLFQVTEHHEIDRIISRMGNIGIVTPDGVYYGKHGVPSGSTLTNEVDSDAQYLVAKQVVNPQDVSDINGDDGAYTVDDPDKLISNFIDHGLVVNEDKTHISDDYFIYLQNYFSRESDGSVYGKYPIYRAYMRARFLERWTNFEEFGIDGQNYFNIRLISILENVRYHPLFRQLVKFFVDNDKFGLKVTEQGIIDYVRMINDTSGAQGILFNQRGDDVKGIRNFATFKLIEEISS